MIIIIVGIAKNRIIGKDNRLPWSIPEDLKKFKRITSGNTLIMGRKTFESIGKPLPNRFNIVLSRSMQSESDIEGIEISSSVDDAIAKAKKHGKDIFIIGGTEIYRQFLPIADRLFISHIKKEYQGDSYFPEYDESEWEVESKEQFDEFDFVVYKRK